MDFMFAHLCKDLLFTLLLEKKCDLKEIKEMRKILNDGKTSLENRGVPASVIVCWALTDSQCCAWMHPQMDDWSHCCSANVLLLLCLPCVLYSISVLWHSDPQEEDGISLVLIDKVWKMLFVQQRKQNQAAGIHSFNTKQYQCVKHQGWISHAHSQGRLTVLSFVFCEVSCKWWRLKSR